MIFRAYHGKDRFPLLSPQALTAILILLVASAVWPVLSASPAYAANPIAGQKLGLERVQGTVPLTSHSEFAVSCPPGKSAIGGGAAIYTPGDLGGAYLRGISLSRDADPARDRPAVLADGSAMPIPQQGQQTDPNRPGQFLAAYAICAVREALPPLVIVRNTVENKIGAYNSAQAQVDCPAGTTTMSAYGRVVTDSRLVFLRGIIPDNKGAFAYGVAIPLLRDGSGEQPPQKWSIEVTALCAPIGSLDNLTIKKTVFQTQNSTTASKSCATGKFLIGVGGDVSGGDMRGAFLTDMAPDNINGNLLKATAVIGHYVPGYADDHNWHTNAYAICMNGSHDDLIAAHDSQGDDSVRPR